METARTEHCPECQGTSVHNQFHFVPGRRTLVYVQCASCGAFVSRYALERYTSNKPYESLLQTLSAHRSHYGDSAHQVRKQLESYGEEVSEGYRRVLGLLAKQEDQRKIEQILADDL
jgi:endogenous inhibitor of DNA gyrase (YacG/DUF329 family)